MGSRSVSAQQGLFAGLGRLASCCASEVLTCAVLALGWWDADGGRRRPFCPPSSCPSGARSLGGERPPFLCEPLAGAVACRRGLSDLAPDGRCWGLLHSGVSREERELAGAWCLPSRKGGGRVRPCPGGPRAVQGASGAGAVGGDEGEGSARARAGPTPGERRPLRAQGALCQGHTRRGLGVQVPRRPQGEAWD